MFCAISSSMIKHKRAFIFKTALLKPFAYFSKLKYTTDLYKSVHVDFQSLPENQADFSKVLIETEQEWQSNEMKAVWLRLNAQQANLLPEALQKGYEMHHATKEYIMLSKWLRQNEVNKLPGYASHYVGCGGTVINGNNELLVINEKFGYNTKTWSFPGGRADAGELITQTAEREIFEELGIKTKAVDLLFLRESSKSLFGKPDIYFSFILLTVEPTPQVTMCKDELLDYKWVPISQIDEFISSQTVSHYHVQRRMIDKINELYKAGFDFKKDRLTNWQAYQDYPSKGNIYTIFEPTK